MSNVWSNSIHFSNSRVFSWPNDDTVFADGLRQQPGLVSISSLARPDVPSGRTLIRIYLFVLRSFIISNSFWDGASNRSLRKGWRYLFLVYFVFMASKSPHLLAPAWLAAALQISLKITPPCTSFECINRGSAVSQEGMVEFVACSLNSVSSARWASNPGKKFRVLFFLAHSEQIMGP